MSYFNFRIICAVLIISLPSFLIQASATEACVVNDDLQTNDNPFCLEDSDGEGSNDDDAIASICGTDGQPDICAFALNSLNKIHSVPINMSDNGNIRVPNCYSHESSPTSQTQPDIEVELNSDPIFARTDCSGWIDYVLDRVGSDLDTVKRAQEEIKSYNTDRKNDGVATGDKWPRAFLYNDYFNRIQNNMQESDSWSAFSDLKEMEPGDFLSWCLGQFCDHDVSGNPKGDTGHIMVVLAKNKITDFDQVKAMTHYITESEDVDSLDDVDDLSFWSVGVADSSSFLHGSSFGTERQFTIGEDTLKIVDNRSYGTLTGLERTHCNNSPNYVEGGLGAGVIILAQWNNSNNGTTWARAFRNSSDVALRTDEPSKFRIAIGRVK